MTDRELLEDVRALLVRLLKRDAASAFPLKEAASRMGIGLTRLRELISRGEVVPCTGSPRLIPVSEIERFTAPRPVGSKLSGIRQRGPRSRTADGQRVGVRIRALSKDED